MDHALQLHHFNLSIWPLESIIEPYYLYPSNKFYLVLIAPMELLDVEVDIFYQHLNMSESMEQVEPFYILITQEQPMKVLSQLAIQHS